MNAVNQGHATIPPQERRTLLRLQSELKMSATSPSHAAVPRQEKRTLLNGEELNTVRMPTSQVPTRYVIPRRLPTTTVKSIAKLKRMGSASTGKKAIALVNDKCLFVKRIAMLKSLGHVSIEKNTIGLTIDKCL
jgi:hypothetical protein